MSLFSASGSCQQFQPIADQMAGNPAAITSKAGSLATASSSQGHNICFWIILGTLKYTIRYLLAYTSIKLEKFIFEQLNYRDHLKMNVRLYSGNKQEIIGFPIFSCF